MKYKEGVYTEVVRIQENGDKKRLFRSIEIKHAELIFDRLHKEYTGKDGVVTAIFDGTHKENSKHYTGNAEDYRTWHLWFLYKEYEDRVLTINEFVQKLRNELGSSYDIIIHWTIDKNKKQSPSHIHIEYDPK